MRAARGSGEVRAVGVVAGVSFSRLILSAVESSRSAIYRRQKLLLGEVGRGANATGSEGRRVVRLPLAEVFKGAAGAQKTTASTFTTHRYGEQHGASPFSK